MGLSDVSPSDAVSGDETGATTEAGDGADSAAEAVSGRATSPSDVLMSTTPDLAAEDVQEQTGLDLAGAHLLIMIRKMVAAVVPSTDDDGGLPAIGNGVLAAYHYLTGAPRGGGGDDDEDGSGDVQETEESFRSLDESESGEAEISVEQRPDYHDPALGGAPA